MYSSLDIDMFYSTFPRGFGAFSDIVHFALKVWLLHSGQQLGIILSKKVYLLLYCLFLDKCDLNNIRNSGFFTVRILFSQAN